MERKIEGMLAVIAAFSVMQSSALNPMISVWIAIFFLSSLGVYKFLR